MKICPECKIEKLSSEFTRCAQFPDHLSFYCRECAAKLRKVRYHANLEENRRKKNEEQKKRRRENPERFAEYDRTNYQRHRERELARGREYWRKNRWTINKKQILKLRKMGTPAQPGYVYFAKFPYLINEKCCYKIGISVQPLKRMKSISAHCPVPVSLEILIKTADMTLLEAEFHHRFSEGNSNKEWFFLSDDDINRVLSENECLLPPFSL